MNATVQKATTRSGERTQSAEVITPEVNIYENAEGYLIEAEMPGVDKDGLEITLEGDEITIVGRRGNEVVPGQALLRERQLADFRRVFELDPAIDTTKINAKMNQGVLILTLPKSEQVKPRRITVSD